MGCTESKISDQNAVHRCERRKSFVKQAGLARSKLATEHARYIHSISSMATSFKIFSDGEFIGGGGGDSGAPRRPPAEAEAAPPVQSSSAFSSSSEEASSSSSEMIATTTKQQHAMRLWSTPAESRTVILSPPRDPRYMNIRRRMYEEEYDDDDDFYRPPPPPDPYHQRRQASASSPPPPPALSGDWDDLVDIFRPPPVGRREIPSDGEDIPALEEGEEEDDDDDEEDDEDDEEEENVGVMFRSVSSTSKVQVQTQEAIRGKMKVETKDISAHRREDSSETKNISPLRREDSGAKNISPLRREDSDASSRTKNISAHRREDSDASSTMEVFGRGSSSTSDDPEAQADPGVFDRQVDPEDDRQVDEPTVKKNSTSPMQLIDILKEQFVKASEAGKPVLRMLEARKLHNNLERGASSDHSSRLFSALSNHWSPRTMSASKDDFESLLSEECGMTGSHTGTLERLYAWEKKLFEEVKSWESLNVEFDKKRKVLRNQDAKGAKAESIDKTRASMKALETQISVALQAIEASSSAIQRITDEEVLPQLMELLEGMLGMWKGMHESHSQMLNAVTTSKLFQNPVLEATSTFHMNATLQLEACLTSWHTTLSSFTKAQKEYMNFLKLWIELALKTQQQEKETKKHKGKAPPKIQFLCQAWYEAFDNITSNTNGSRRSSTVAESSLAAERFVPIVESVERMSNAIKTFAETLGEIKRQQAEEIRIQKRAEVLAKDLNKKIMSLNSSDRKNQDVVRDKESTIDGLRIKVQDEKIKFTKAIQQTRWLTSSSLQDGLPTLFKELSESASSCMDTYQNLYTRVKEHRLD